MLERFRIRETMEQAMAIAAEAAALVRSRSSQEIRHKGEVDLVTDVDLASEALIAHRLQERFPGCRLVLEEAGIQGEVSTGATWFVDPLDGTTNFAHGFPQYAVVLALQLDGVLEVGVVADVTRQELYCAGRGAGAIVVDARGGATPLRVSRTRELSQALLATGFPYDRHRSLDNNLSEFQAFLRRAQGIRRAGSAALDLVAVARGWFDGYWEMKLQPWDIAAGSLIVEEAGGRVTCYDGSPLDLARHQILASNGTELHEAMQRLLAEVRQGRPVGELAPATQPRLTEDPGLKEFL